MSKYSGWQIVDVVKDICSDVAKPLAGAEIIAPLPIWDATGRSMGVQIKVPRLMGAEQQKCEAVASFVLTMEELQSRAEIRRKAFIAVQAMQWDVQVKVRPMPKSAVTIEQGVEATVAHASN